MSKKYALTLDLQDDPQLIAEYEAYHQKVWPEILKSIKDAGIQKMEIFRWKTRLFMYLEVSDDFSFERKAQMDANNPKVQEWELIMWKYQKGLPGVPKGEKWQLMDRVFEGVFSS